MSLSSFCILLLTLLCLFSSAFSYKILVLCPMPARSHNNLGRGIAEILHNANHEVTYVTAFPVEKPLYRQIGVAATMQAKDESDNHFASFDGLAKTSPYELLLYIIPQFVTKSAELMFETQEFKKLLNDENEKFDLVVMEYFFNHGMAGLGVKYDCPVIILSPVSLMHWVARLTGNPISPSTVTNAFLSFNSKMTLSERVINTLMAIFQEGYGRFYLDPLLEGIYKKYLPEAEAKVPFADLYKKIALVYSNSHPALGSSRPLLPNVVEIGGYHMGEAKALPEEYQKILDGAKNGVIYFSMGSNLKSSNFPQNVKEGILKALSKRKELILWKYEEDLPGKPKNVIIKSWMPQASILTHPNVKLFISHGGLLSTTEAAASGVPILSVPIFGDQFLNAKATEGRGCGFTIEYKNMTEASLTWALDEVLGNLRYTETAKKTYRLFHDRPVKPKELINFYANHVIKTGGAKHLSGPILPLISLLQLDVLIVIALPFIILLLVTVWLCRTCCKKSASKKHKEKRQ